jgi:hypothetical protein
MAVQAAFDVGDEVIVTGAFSSNSFGSDVGYLSTMDRLIGKKVTIIMKRPELSAYIMFYSVSHDGSSRWAYPECCLRSAAGCIQCKL